MPPTSVTSVVLGNSMVLYSFISLTANNEGGKELLTHTLSKASYKSTWFNYESFK